MYSHVTDTWYVADVLPLLTTHAWPIATTFSISMYIGCLNINNTGGGAGERNVNDGEELEEVNNRGEELEGGT